MDKISIKKEIKRVNDMEIWSDCYMSSIIPSRPTLKNLIITKTGNSAKQEQFFYTESDCSDLESYVKNEDDDSLDHAKECPFMETNGMTTG